jgi:hypothetical protein
MSWRTWTPHRAPVAEQRFVGAVRQIVGGRRWSLCFITRIEQAALPPKDSKDSGSLGFGFRLMWCILRGHPFTTPWTPAIDRSVTRSCRCGTYVEVTHPSSGSGEAPAREAVPFQFSDPRWPGLVKLAEEAGEIVQVIAKIIGTGGTLAFRDGQRVKRARLVEEMADLQAALQFVHDHALTGVEQAEFETRCMAKLTTFNRWRLEDAPDAGA